MLTDKAGLVNDEIENRLVIAVSSDKGLCGGIHGGIARYIKAKLDNGDGVNSKLVVVGDRARQILGRTHAHELLVEAKGLGRGVPVFSEAALVAQEVLATGVEYDSVSIVFNYFKNAGSYEVTEIELPGPGKIADNGNCWWYCLILFCCETFSQRNIR